MWIVFWIFLTPPFCDLTHRLPCDLFWSLFKNHWYFCGEKWFHEFFCTFSRFYERAVTLVDDDSFLWLLFIKINAWTGMQIWSFHLMFQRKSRLTPTARADLLKCSREIFHNDATKKGLVTKLKFAKEWNSYPTATEQEHCHRVWSGKKYTRVIR